LAGLGRSTSHSQDNQIPSPSELWFLPPIRLSRNNPCCTELRFFSAMARRLHSRLKQSSIYEVSLANLGLKESGCTYHLHFCGSMRVTLYLSSGPSTTPLLLNMIGILVQELRYGARKVLKNPCFTAVAVLTLALGIGANTAIFSAVNALILQPLPYKDPDRLVQVFSQNEKMHEQSGWLSPLDFVDLKNQSTAFEEIVGWRQVDFIDRHEHEPVSVKGAAISTNLFIALGVQPFLGRTFLPEEVQTTNSQVVILSHGFWQRRFGADRKIIGRTVRLSDKTYAVVG